ncbi:unnamed protein product [Dibothriocephalus latus]|uniref:Galactosyltransferase N-terminal domain-containing protein n=1 Tax=Dibothriocephalus latus TaxID=60516 RepID=A0A3P7LML2_DIBLA|nr:unnamed protein product [Dibothriocephalus latus]
MWGLLPNPITWNGESKFTDVAYRLESLASDEIQSNRVVWTPDNCHQPETVEIIIPCRNRFVNLSVFLNHMHSFLRHQRRRYTMFVIEQIG